MEKYKIGFIEGDGIGPDIWKASKLVFDEAFKLAENKEIEWVELFAGEKAYEKTGQYLPEETLNDIKKLKIAIKGPLATPVGKGFRSLNVALRQYFDLYACIRPVRYFNGVPNPMKHPEKLDVVIFRENTEDVYAGIEWESGSKEALKLLEIFREHFSVNLPKDSGIGIKPISRKKSYRIVRKAIQYAIDNLRKKVTLVHKGNIMKFTEGAFMNWGYELAAKEFSEHTVSESEQSNGKIVINDRIADAMFQQLLLRPDEYDVIVTPNLNGDYLSDACAAQVGGLGIAPGANIGDEIAIFEATHGTAPKYAGQDKVNPGSLILSGALMFRHIGENKTADLIENAFGKAILCKKVTYDLARQMKDAKEVKCSEFAEEVVKKLHESV
jgi:isocitrate dehydrogenase